MLENGILQQLRRTFSYCQPTAMKILTVAQLQKLTENRQNRVFIRYTHGCPETQTDTVCGSTTMQIYHV